MRFLIEALRVECEGRSEYGEIWKLLGGVERILVIAFALIRCGADDPLPWILVVDGVLRKLLRKLGSFSSSGEPTLLQKKVFGELALWCHGTAINAFIIRLPPLEDRYVKGQELMVRGRTESGAFNISTNNATEKVVQDGVDLQSALCQQRLHASSHAPGQYGEQEGTRADVGGYARGSCRKPKHAQLHLDQPRLCVYLSL